ncbi:hypothetical protein, partial [Klebsiella michiganensis]|uniref:hypothetical protein n=1 Tax=Klebsiella michiganensis TaxID=1134687 RepID=UPI00102273CD
MKINFPPETYEALINRANSEDKPAAALVSELITAILSKEENNELKSTKEGANKQVISSQADSLIKISRIWADF